ncbi:MAG: hypothetical protein HDR12_17495 [Lachnospiraceae bacterium]|nr:hypothetical protein [Lachnospiraceae bacterium]
MTDADIAKKLHTLVSRVTRLKNFDLESFYYNFNRLISTLEFYHNSIGKKAKDTKELSAIQYDVPKSKMPKEGQVAYFYIETSYPKEIYNSHWCLVLKDLGSLLIVIPLTSIKKDSNPVDKQREMIVKIKNFEEDGCSKLKINQIFSAGLMRLDQSKKIYDLQTNFSYVKKEIKNILNLS